MSRQEFNEFLDELSESVRTKEAGTVHALCLIARILQDHYELALEKESKP